MIKYKNKLLNKLAEMNRERGIMSNQGERVIPGESEEWLLKSHVDKYLFVKDRLNKGDTVLDCACGAGYGTFLLAENAEKVRGIDIDEGAVRFCMEHYSAPNAVFKLSDAKKLGFPAGYFDIVVSFETIEHVPPEEGKKIIKEFKRVLKPSGTLYISTPNRVPSGIGRGAVPINKFHRIEWSVEEFYLFLKEFFDNVSMFGSRVKSRNKFHPKYLKSKFLRKFGPYDIQKINCGPGEYCRFNDREHFQHLNLIAVCTK